LALLLTFEHSFAFYLFRHEIDVASQLGNAEELERATFAMQSAVRTTVYVIRQGASGLPLDMDTLAFWAHHMVFVTAMMHIKYGNRDEFWASDLDLMIDYLRYFAPRYTLYSISAFL
jgi:hypothetical protein